MHVNPGSTQGKGNVSGRGHHARVASVALVPSGRAGPKACWKDTGLG